MLILTRKIGESIYIGDNIKVTVVEVKGNQARIGIDASRDVRIYREEIYQQIIEENKEASAPAGSVLPDGFRLKTDDDSDGSTKKRTQPGFGGLVVRRPKKEGDE